MEPIGILYDYLDPLGLLFQGNRGSWVGFRA